MNFADLQVFKAVVEEGGIVKAAQKLHRVPSNVSTRIKQLEIAVGIPLFHRNRQRLHLSPSGELLLGYADRLIDLSEEARHVVSGATPQGLLKLGALESTTASRLSGVLADFTGLIPTCVWNSPPAPTMPWSPPWPSGVSTRLLSPSLRPRAGSRTCPCFVNASW